ncbi:hypothetical protein [Oligoflexus tunisiensis]|uniref:hypothetical protein n=1 Tax=Oligoflexus tunisiensis TaxID=708132 RepID=UPI00114CDF76|nr:hypothetical protein [Oligoflexus tunisiensis]
MQKVALSLLWQDGDQANLDHARAYAQVVPRVFVIDRRSQGEAYASLADPRLHYAPFRQNVSLGTALNRALHLAHEENYSWLWITETRTLISGEQLLHWSQKASSPTRLYRFEDAAETPNLLRRPVCGCLIEVDMARSLGGWDPALPAQLALQDFQQRIQSAGVITEKGIQVQHIGSGLDLAPWETVQSLWTLIRRRFLPPGVKSR